MWPFSQQLRGLHTQIVVSNEGQFIDEPCFFNALYRHLRALLVVAKHERSSIVVRIRTDAWRQDHSVLVRMLPLDQQAKGFVLWMNIASRPNPEASHTRSKICICVPLG